ncbi:uncharacterized protein V6R79_010416, partial [Siganus canaliculatus]
RNGATRHPPLSLRIGPSDRKLKDEKEEEEEEEEKEEEENEEEAGPGERRRGGLNAPPA